MSSPSKLDRVISIVLTLATVVAVGVLIEGRLNPGSEAPTRRVELIKDWATIMATHGVALEDTSRVVKVAVFTDFECPFCRTMDSVLAAIQGKHPGKIARAVVHLPLPMHTQALSAAKAFECATAQGKGAEMHAALYAHQRSFGMMPWREIASNAHVADIEAFQRCTDSVEVQSRITDGIQLAENLAVTTTPTVVVNGWLFDPSSPASIEKAVVAVLGGKSPKP